MHADTGPAYSAYINNHWIISQGAAFESLNPATEDVIWRGHEATPSEVAAAVDAATQAFVSWSLLPAEQRKERLLKLGSILQYEQKNFAETISQECGKPLWDALSEVATMINKIDITINAYDQRCQEKVKPQNDAISITRHRAHGVLAVLGPFNFPGHLPFGQIVPALLAGNTLVFKPSELTPLCGEKLIQLFERAGFPAGVINLLQGGRNVGQLLVENEKINGALFVGSWHTGKALAAHFANYPHKILALEMGGNNPLVVTDVFDVQAAAYISIQSAFLSAGQRCTCARRLIVPQGSKGNAFIQSLVQMIAKISIGNYTQRPEPFIGPVISEKAMHHLLNAQAHLKAQGATCLLEMQRCGHTGFFLSPGLIDVTNIHPRDDVELFGPLLQLIRVPDFNQAIQEANNTSFGLTAGLLSDRKEEYEYFLAHVHAGIINWNMPLTGSSSGAPFGGIGHSGNNRPSGYYAIDYCNYPVASLEKPKVCMPNKLTPGLNIPMRNIGAP